MKSLQNVIVTEVTNHNFKELWSQILESVSNSCFIAIDAEMSGLGTTKKTMSADLNERYAAISSFAATRSIISLGLACFKCTTDVQCSQDKSSSASSNGNAHCKAINFSVSIYNIILLCSDPYTVDPKAVQFLVNHGFNFNKQFAEGISFYKGNDRVSDLPTKACMRKLFSQIIQKKKPLVVHNGLTDLIFMYQSFYAQCPSKLTAFVADLSEIFPSGIFDTKYIAEFLDHTPASFLLYLFRYNLLANEELHNNGKPAASISFSDLHKDAMLLSLCDVKSPANSAPICEKYSAYGWCIKGIHCKMNHNIDAIIEQHKRKTNKQKRKSKSSLEKPFKKRLSDTSNENILSSAKWNNDKVKCTTINSQIYDNDSKRDSTHIKEIPDNNGAEVESKIDANQASQNISLQSTSFFKTFASIGTDGTENQNESDSVATKKFSAGHRSGVDAFMTGYIFAVFIVSKFDSLKNNEQSEEQTSNSKFIPYLSKEAQTSVMNKLYLSGKCIPLVICKSAYTKTSKNHNEKIVKLLMK